jgi:uncharacterized alpha-E superfamily protein
MVVVKPSEDPRSVVFAKDKWLTDSRVYNLIWMGRWLERAENICRALEAAALLTASKTDKGFNQALEGVSAAWGLSSKNGHEALMMLIWQETSSSIYSCLKMARENASRIGPIELISSINKTIMELDSHKEKGEKMSREEMQGLVARIRDGLMKTFDVIEMVWFRRQPLSEEELLRPYAQQE